MPKRLSICALLLFGNAGVFHVTAQPSSATTQTIGIIYSIAGKGLDYTAWNAVSILTNIQGQTLLQTNTYRELATGMNIWSSNEWVAASEKLQVSADGQTAGCTNAQHHVSFAANINTPGAIHTVTPDGQRLRSHIMGLAYYDPVAQKSVLIAELQDSIGQLLDGNRILYTNALTDFQSDIRYTFSIHGLEQDIILRQQPPSPSEWSLGQYTRLQIWTEFVEAPTPSQRFITNRMTGMVDQSLDFGTMHLNPGKAYMDAGEPGRLIPVVKSWQIINGRTFLVEEVPLSAVAAQIQNLPPNSNSASKTGQLSHSGIELAQNSLRNRTFDHPVLLPPKQNSKKSRPIKIAKSRPPKDGFVLDYNLTLNGNLTNYVFQSDTTYYVTNTVNLYGTVVLEGGAVIKSSTNSSGLQFIDAVVCQTAPYRPVVFTAKDDNSVGATISGSTGTPSTYYGYPVNIWCNVTNLQYLRIKYAECGIYYAGESSTLILSHSQFGNCLFALQLNDGSPAQLHNCLFYNDDTAIGTGDNVIGADNLTVAQCGTLATDFDVQDSILNLTNSLLVDVTNWGTFATYATNFTATNASASAVFQQMGGAGYYLLANSFYHEAGTTNIDPIALEALQQKTTYAPFSLSNVTFAANLIISPEIARDTNSSPDLGFHYDPIDFMMSKIYISNGVTMMLTNGVVIGEYASGGCLNFDASSTLISTGQPQLLNRFVRYETVQEGDWPVSGTGDYDPFVLGTNVQATLQFTDVAASPGSGGNTFTLNDGVNLTVSDSQFHAAGFVMNISSSANANFYSFNNLFERCGLVIQDDDPEDYGYGPIGISFQNNLFYGGTAQLDHLSYEAIWEIYDNFFCQTTISSSGSGELDNGFNAYLNTSQTLTNWEIASGGDLMLTNFSFQTSFLGTYYQPTNSLLIDKGNTTANLLGLYHYTTQTNQIKETNSIVDIGFHYVAVNSSGLPDDSSGDGIPDYLKDSNGDGVYEASIDLGNWQTSSTCGDGTSDHIKYLEGRNLNVCTSYTDTNGILFLQVYTPLK